MTTAAMELPALLRGEPAELLPSLREPGRVMLYVGCIILGAGFYGAAVGAWRAPVQALYTGIKLPLILLLTALGNGLLNGMLAPLLSLKLSFRQSLLLVLMSFCTLAMILGAWAPLLLFLVWSSPAVDSGSRLLSHSLILVSDVAVIAGAGVAANVRLLRLLAQFSGNTWAARRVLIAWLAGNLLLGSQLSWNLRPFIGSPGLPVQFVRADAFNGNFFESVFRACGHLLGQ